MAGKPIEIALSYLADDGGLARVHDDLEPLTLAIGESSSVSINLSTSGIDIHSLQYSGRVHVTGHVQVEEEAGVRLVVSPPIFYHPEEDQQIAVYSEDTLRGQFRAGDFTNTHGDAFVEENVILDRVVYGGAGVVSEAPIGVDP